LEKDWPRYHLRRISLSSRSKRKTAPRQPPTLRREGKKIKEEYIGKCDEEGNDWFSDNFWQRFEQRFYREQQFNDPPRQYTRSPYEVLGVPATATTLEIRQAYFKLAKQYHPDCNPAIDHKIMAEINVAYQILMK
jgi:hypothetical protein